MILQNQLTFAMIKYFLIQEKHKSFLDFDPSTGAPLRAHGRIQFNMFIGKTPDVPLMVNFPEALLPIMWVDEGVEVPDFVIDMIKKGHTRLMILR